MLLHSREEICEAIEKTDFLLFLDVLLFLLELLQLGFQQGKEKEIHVLHKKDLGVYDQKLKG